VRGTGFDAWATQRLVGNVVDGEGVAQAQWASVWVSPQGRLTLELNLCADPFRSRPALPAGDYTVAVGPSGGPPIAATNISLSPPPEPPPAEADETGPPPTSAGVVPTPTPAPFVLPAIAPTPTPGAASAFALPSVAATPTATPRVGPGSSSQPLPPGAPGMLVDGWQLVVTGVTADAWSGIRAAIPSSVPPASDQRAFMVRVQATYLGQGSGVFSAMRLVLGSGIQASYDQLHNGCGVVPEMVPSNLVTAGGVVRGNVCFTVRASDSDALVLIDNQPLDHEKVFFALR
jgi:hypothetical protein